MNVKPHKLECRIEGGEPVWRIDCPYLEVEEDKPCAAYADFEDTDEPHEFLPGCGADVWLDESGCEIEEMLTVGITGEIGMKVDVGWEGDGWVVLRWLGDEA